jgi:hypothetical protein
MNHALPLSRPFDDQTFYDKWAVNRGALRCDLHLPVPSSASAGVSTTTTSLRVVSTHFNPPPAVLGLGWLLPQWLLRAIDRTPGQLQNLCDFVREDSVVGQPLLVAGDFNVPLNSPHFTAVKHKLGSPEVGLEHLTDQLLNAPGAPYTVNPPWEFTLTGGGREPETLDYAYGRGVRLTHSAVLQQRSGAEPDDWGPHCSRKAGERRLRRLHRHSSRGCGGRRSSSSSSSDDDDDDNQQQHLDNHLDHPFECISDHMALHLEFEM